MRHETGVSRFVPSIEVLERLAKALEVTSSDLVQKRIIVYI